MNTPHEELAALYVLDQLDPAERAGFEARLLLDPALAAFVRDLESALARRVHALPRHEPSPDLFARIEQRLASLPPSRLPIPTPAPAATRLIPWASLARWGIAAVIALGIATLAIQSLRPVPAAPRFIFVGLDGRSSTFAELPVRTSSNDRDARFIQLASLAEKFWEKPEHLPIKSSAPAAGSHGYALFDPGSNQGFIAIEQLPAPAADQCYHLWIVDTASGRFRDAGILPLRAARDGLFSFTVAPVPVAHVDRLTFLVTIEATAPASPAQPRGQVVLGDRPI